MSLQNVAEKFLSLNKDLVIGISAHVRPDGDACGSIFGLTTALKNQGYKVYPLFENGRQAPLAYEYMENFELATTFQELEKQGVKLDVLFILDTPALRRAALGSDVLKSVDVLFRIDHHKNNDIEASYTWEDTSYASASTMVWDFIAACGFEQNEAIAECCLTGLISDTGGFRYQNTHAEVLRKAAEMMDSGAKIYKLSNAIFYSKSKAALALEERILSRRSVHNNDKVVVSWLSYADYNETGAVAGDAEDLSEVIRVMKGPEVAIIITKISEGIRASLRSKSGFNVAEVAKNFNGGGHPAAAGISINDPDLSVDQFIEQLLVYLPGYNA